MDGKRIARSLLMIATLSLAAAGPSFGERGHAPGGAAEMEMHHLHMLLNQGISMMTEGTNLVMLAGMQTTPALDRPTIRHGQTMIADGREIVRRALHGPEMRALSEGGAASSPLLRYSLELGEAMAAYMKRLEQLDLDRMSSHRTLQRINIILNHALAMASEGANMVMVARMEMAGAVDRFSLEQGERMIAHARHLHRETVEGEAMERLRGLGMTSESSSMMKLTLDLAEAVSRVIELLARMPPPSSPASPPG